MAQGKIWQVHANVVKAATPNTVIKQLSLELTRQTDPDFKLDQIVVEVLRPNITIKKTPHVIFI